MSTETMSWTETFVMRAVAAAEPAGLATESIPANCREAASRLKAAGAIWLNAIGKWHLWDDALWFCGHNHTELQLNQKLAAMEADGSRTCPVVLASEKLVKAFLLRQYVAAQNKTKSLLYNHQKTHNTLWGAYNGGPHQLSGGCWAIARLETVERDGVSKDVVYVSGDYNEPAMRRHIALVSRVAKVLNIDVLFMS
jgi:hypothetical protein